MTDINVTIIILMLMKVRADMNPILLKELKAIADPTRLDILFLLSESRNLCGCHLLEKLDITQGTLSHHRKILSEAGLVTIEKEGKWRHYSLNKEKIRHISETLFGIASSESKECGCCK